MSGATANPKDKPATVSEHDEFIEFEPEPIGHPSEEFDAYKREFLEWLNIVKEFGINDEGEADEAAGVLMQRSRVQEALKLHPDGLTKEQRKRLRELDRLLRENADLLLACIPDPSWDGKRLGYPRSHWWWYLDEKKKKKRKRRATSKRAH